VLAVCGGMPLAAERLAARGGGALLGRFVKDVAGLPQGDPLRLAGQWEAWLKSKEALAAGLDLPLLVDWMQRWVTDLASLALGGAVRFFPGHEPALAALARRSSVAAASSCYNELAQIRRVAQHPLNLRLTLEDMLLRYARALTGPRP
jgi:DNA polymerase-3 subunit delta'